MSLRVRLSLLLAGVVAVTLLVAWVLTRRAVLAPFTEKVRQAQLDQAVYAASEIERGTPPPALSERLGVRVHVRPRLPRFLREDRRGPAGRRMHCEDRDHKGYRVFICQGPHAPIAVRLPDDRWVMVRPDVDVRAPGERIGIVLALVAGVIILLSAWVAVRISRPLTATVDAMQHMAAGELSHRLPETGGRELVEVARAFNGMADRIDRMLRSEKEMMAGISHELRTPLARLRLELELLRDAKVEGKRIDAMEQDVEEVDHLIGELLELSRLSLGERQMERVQVDLRSVVDEAVERQALPSHRVVVEGEAAPVTGDRPRLVRVVGNLLQNAGKYAPKGTTVRVRLDGASVEVVDEGKGAPPEELPRLFEPFYRGQRQERSSATGYGLGLMYAAQVVDLCGGRIEAKNAEGGGLSIRFTLPPAGRA